VEAFYGDVTLNSGKQSSAREMLIPVAKPLDIHAMELYSSQEDASQVLQ